MIKKLTLAAVAGIALVACAPTKKPVGIENVKTKIPVIVEKEKGVSIYSLNTAHGQIKVYLPEKPVIRRTFSGRVFALPVGLTEEEKDKNLNYLEGYIVSLIDPNTGKEITSAKIGEVLKAVPEKSSTYPIVIKKGEEYIAKSQVYVSENPVIPEELKKNPIPEYTTDTIVPLKSNSVDGDVSNTLAFSDIQACVPLAEIEGFYTVASCNSMTPGLNDISFYEKGKKIYSGNINYVLCRITGTTKLVLGQKTNFKFTVEGKNLSDFRVHIESEGAIEVPVKDFKINPYKIKVSKTGGFPEKEVEEYSFTVPVVAKTPGSFKIRCEPQKSF